MVCNDFFSGFMVFFDRQASSKFSTLTGAESHDMMNSRIGTFYPRHPTSVQTLGRAQS